jgi:CRISPR-associated helicase Cas3/CRISPR-associated endonuclease Cas3-HD
LSSLTLSLPAHLEDAMAVARALWRTFIPDHVKDLIVTEVGSEEAAIALVGFLAGTHDAGKASNAFQQNLPDGSAPKLRDHGLAISTIRYPIPHGTLGQVAMCDWLTDTLGKGPGATHLAEVIGGHHGRNPTRGDLQCAKREYLLLERSAWSEARIEILEEMADRSGVRPYLSDLVQRGLSLPIRVLLQAIVILADWIASDSEHFPYVDRLPSAELAENALAELGLIPPWPPTPHGSDVPATANDLFRQRFPTLRGACANPVQEEAVRLAATAAEPCLLVIEARPGLGKTEAGLMAAEILAARFGCGGVFVGLPTMATANPMFARVEAWLETMGGKTTSLNLAHGKAALNADFEALVQRSRFESLYDDAGVTAGVVLAVSWLRGRKRSLLANCVVGTIDQYLMAGLKAKHVVLRHLALAGKVVIVDEIHAADDYMREYALTMLEWLGRYRTPVILMSATLPPQQRQEYLAAYARGRGSEPPSPSPAVAYTRLSLYDGSLHESLLEPSEEPVQVRIETLDDSPEKLVGVLRESLADGGCAAVIRNTVTRAQETLRQLREEFGDDVVLHHSRFIAPHRAAREQRLVEQLGRDGTRPHRIIVVGTQVLEQSLDIDFDIMVTDLAPIDLLLQRAGRLHRHPRSRPPLLGTPRLLITGADWQQIPPHPSRGSLAVYGHSKLLRAAAVLAEALKRGWLVLPEQTPGLVADGYDPELRPPPEWESEWAAAEDQAARRSADARRRARTFAIAPPVDSDSMAGWLAAPADDPEDPKHVGKAQVRDGSDSLEVIVVRRDEDNALRLPSGPGPMAGAEIPDVLPIDDWRLAKAMAQTTISLPQSMCANPAQLDATILALEKSLHYDTWQTSGWIKGQLALVLDAEGRTRLAGFDLAYSDELGLTATRVEGAL